MSSLLQLQSVYPNCCGLNKHQSRSMDMRGLLMPTNAISGRPVNNYEALFGFAAVLAR